MSEVIVSTAASTNARMAASFQLKNQLCSNEFKLKQQYRRRWLTFPTDTREYVKKNLLEALGTETNRPSSVALCIAHVAAAELLVDQWQELIPLLVNNATNPNSTERVKEATLDAIGYTCEEIKCDAVFSQSNQILTAIVNNMRGSDTSMRLRLSATNALINSLEFAESNFEIESERNFIMEVVCQTTQSTDIEIKVASLQCLTEIVILYYEYMEPYMAQALLGITLEAMKSNIDEVALHGIVFWNSVAEEELSLSKEGSEIFEDDLSLSSISRHYAKGALQYLVPVLTQKIVDQVDLDHKNNSISKAVCDCLKSLASCCGNVIFPCIFPFVEYHFKNSDCHYRNAALIAFGCILKGPEYHCTRLVVEQIMPNLIELMYDSSVSIRCTAAWTLGRVIKTVHEVAINKIYLKSVLDSLINGLKAEPSIAEKVCKVLILLARVSHKFDNSDETGDQSETYFMSDYFNTIIQQLLEITNHSDGPTYLRSLAYNAMIEIIRGSPRDCYVTVRNTIMVIIERLQQVIQVEPYVQNYSDQVQCINIQVLLCNTLQSILKKISVDDVCQISDTIVSILVSILKSSSCKPGDVLEEAFTIITTLVEILGEKFMKYFEVFKLFYCIGLKNQTKPQVCTRALDFIRESFRALKSKMLPYCDEIMTLLLEILTSDDAVYYSVKPQICSSFLDIASNIGSEFEKYLNVVSHVLVQTSHTAIDTTDCDMVDYLNELRTGILQAYTGIVQGLCGTGSVPNHKAVLVEPIVPSILEFIKTISEDCRHSDENIQASVGLLVDLLNVFESKFILMVDIQPIMNLINEGCQSRFKGTTRSAKWIKYEVENLQRLQNAV
ncbi:importin subunit beta-1-like isoform X2 [Copidosoma floridanum]|nr:importin subunit beta-1-like isoform X2 [Copidosoma floridanum]